MVDVGVLTVVFFLEGREGGDDERARREGRRRVWGWAEKIVIDARKTRLNDRRQTKRHLSTFGLTTTGTHYCGQGVPALAMSCQRLTFTRRQAGSEV